MCACVSVTLALREQSAQPCIVRDISMSLSGNYTYNDRELKSVMVSVAYTVENVFFF